MILMIASQETFASKAKTTEVRGSSDMGYTKSGWSVSKSVFALPHTEFT